MVEQNLQSCFLDTGLPSPQVANLLNKATFLFQPTLVSQILTIEQQTAKSEFCNSKNGKILIYRKIKHVIRFRMPDYEQYQIRKFFFSKK